MKCNVFRTCELVASVPDGPEVVEEDGAEDHLLTEPGPEPRLQGERQLGVQEPKTGQQGKKIRTSQEKKRKLKRKKYKNKWKNKASNDFSD